MDLPSRLLSLLACLAFTGVASAGAPTMTTINPIVGGKEDTSTAISYAKLSGAADAVDPDNDTIEFKFVSLSSGTLKKNGGSNVSAGNRLDSSDTWTWSPDDDAFGEAAGSELAAFSVVAYANGEESGTPIVIRIKVAPVNDPPSF